MNFGYSRFSGLGEFTLDQPKGVGPGVIQLGVGGLMGYGAYKLWPKHKVWGVLLGLMALGAAGSAARSLSA